MSPLPEIITLFIAVQFEWELFFKSFDYQLNIDIVYAIHGGWESLFVNNNPKFWLVSSSNILLLV